MFRNVNNYGPRVCQHYKGKSLMEDAQPMLPFSAVGIQNLLSSLLHFP